MYGNIHIKWNVSVFLKQTTRYQLAHHTNICDCVQPATAIEGENRYNEQIGKTTRMGFMVKILKTTTLTMAKKHNDNTMRSLIEKTY